MAGKALSTTVDRVLSVTLTMAAVVMAFVVVQREFLDSTPVASTAQNQPVFYSGWDRWMVDGIMIGDSAATVKIVEFVDLECPGCKAFYETVLRPLEEEFGPSLARVFIHLPLRSHRFATAAAVAAECAVQQGRFAEFEDVTFERQDSLGIKRWLSYAEDAGILDTLQFARCIADQAPLTRVERGRALADSIGIKATPTVFVNGWRYAVPPSRRELSNVVGDLLSGRTPFSDGREP